MVLHTLQKIKATFEKVHIYMPKYGHIYKASKNKTNQDSILKLSTLKSKIITFLSVDDSIIILLSNGTLVIHIGLGMAAQQ